MKDFVSRFRHGLIAAYCPSLPGGGSGNLLPDQSNSRNNVTLTSFSQSDWASSQKGRTLYFDGVDNYGTTQRQIFSGRSIVSVMTWAQTVSGTQIEIGEGDSNTFRAGCGLSGDGNSYIVNSQGGGVVSNFCFASWSAFQGQAVCIVSVLDVTQVLNTDRAKIYIQGLSRSLSYSGSGPLTSSPIGTFTGPTQIGRRPTNDNYSTGNLYCIAVWDRVITAEEAMQLYVLGPRGSSEAVSLKGNLRSTFAKRYAYKPAKPRNYSVIRNRDPNYSTLRQGLVAAYCPSISGQGNVLPDLVGGNHGQLTNMSADDWVSSGDGKALDFDGVDDYVDAGDCCDFTSGFMTISAWIKRNETTTAQRTVVSKFDRTSGVASEDGFGFGVINNTISYAATLDGATHRFSATVADLNVTDWVHIAVKVETNNGSAAALYKNGLQVTASWVTLTGNVTLDNNTYSLRLGNYKYSGVNYDHFSGLVDDVRIYNRALTASEIKLLASKRGIGLEPRKPKITFADLGVQKTYSVVRVKETDYGNLRQGLVGAWCPSLPNGGSGNTLPDVSGYGNHGTLTNMSPDDWVAGQYGRALDFDGSNDYVTASWPYPNPTALTLSAWIYPRANSNFGVIIARQSGTDYAFKLDNKSTLQRWRGYCQNETTGEGVEALDPNTFALNQWYHLAFTATTSVFTLYVNGNSVASASGTVTPFTATGQPITFGGRSIADYFNAILDDLRVYYRVLSPAEIRLLASRPGIGLRQDRDRNTFYQFPSGARRKRILTGMP